MMKKYGLLILVLLSLVGNSLGQDNTLLQLVTDETALQTGQRYTVRIEAQNIEALWAADLQIAYDPSQIYIIGTEAGSPVHIGDFLLGGDTIFNRVESDSGSLRYAFSIFSPADPVSGSGVVGSFEIVPLLAGTAQLQFTTAQVSSIEFVLDATGQRIGGNALDIPFLPVLLEVQITGDPATPPSEATATPTSTPTIDPSLLGNDVTAELEATLVNITAAPRTPSPELPTSATTSAANPILFVGIGIVILAALGFLLLFVFWRRRS